VAAPAGVTKNIAATQVTFTHGPQAFSHSIA